MIQGTLYHVDACHPVEMEISHCLNGWSFLLELLINALSNTKSTEDQEVNSDYWYEIDDLLKVRGDWWDKYFFSKRMTPILQNSKELSMVMAQVSIFMLGIQNTFVEVYLKDILTKHDMNIIRQLELNFVI